MNHEAQLVKEQLLARATRLREIANELGLDALGETLVDDTKRRLDDARVRAAVVGEIKQGKSSLINALLRREILPTGVTPTTGAVVMVRTGAATGPFIDRGDDGREQLEAPRFARLAKGPLHRDAGPEDDEDGTLEYVVEDGLLPAALELVDTPGINDIAKFRASISRGELPRADILILVLDATQLLNRTEMAFLRDAIAAVGGLGDSGAKLLLAVNRIDLIAERERPKLREHLVEELESLAAPAEEGTESAQPSYELFFTDARTASRDPEADTEGVRGVRALQARLFELAEGRASVLPLRARASLLRHATLLGHNAAISSRAATMEIEALRKEIRHVERELTEHELDMTTLRSEMSVARDVLLEASSKRLDAFAEELTGSIDETLRGISMRNLSGHFAGALHDAYITFSHQEAERLRLDLDEITRKAILTHSEQARRRLFHATMRIGFRGPTIYVDPPSVVLEAGLVVIGVAGTAVLYFGNVLAGLVMTIAGPLATLALREKSVRDARVRAKAELPKALHQANDALREQTRRVVDSHLAALDEHLLLANIALGDQLKGVLRTAESRLQALLEQPDAEDRSVEDLAASIASGRAALLHSFHELERELSNIRAELGDLDMNAQADNATTSQASAGVQ